MIIKVLTATASNSSRYVDFSCFGKFKMERRLTFEGLISHLFLKTKQPNDQIGITL